MRSALPAISQRSLLTCRLHDRCHIKPFTEVGMASERFASFAFDQNVHALDAGNIRRQSLYQRIDRELFAEDAGAVLVGKRGIQIDDGCARINEVNAANIRYRSKGMSGA